MKCSKCGAVLKDNAAFCQSCGARVEEETAENTEKTMPETSVTQEMSQEDTPKEDTPKEDAPKEDTPKEDAPKEDAPKEDAPKEDAPKEDAPKEDAPKEDAPKEDAPKGDVPKEDAPKEDAPKEDAPKEDTPKEDAPAQGVTYSAILGENVEKEVASAEAPKKKKSHAGRIVLIVVIVVVVALVLVAAISYLNFSSRGKKTIEAYWQTYVDSDADAVIASVPEQFWDYVAETYGYTASECAEGVAYLFETTKAQLGEELSYDYTATGFSMSKSGVEDALAEYGITCSKCVGYNVDAQLVGEISSQAYNELGMWAVKIDGDWYDMTAMCDIDALCSSGYLDSAIYEVTFGEPIAAYWNAFYTCDVDTVADFLPAGSWEFIEGAYGCDEATARACMEEYITEGLTYSGIEVGTPIEFTASVTDVTLCEEDEVAEYNAYLTDELQADAIAYVTFDATMTAEGADTIEDTSSAVMMEIGDTWYLYDNLYYFATACYYYGGEVVYDDTTAEDDTQ